MPASIKLNVAEIPRENHEDSGQLARARRPVSSKHGVGREKFHVGNNIDSLAGTHIDRCDTDLAAQPFVGLYA
jgi:hypothetical protein